MTTTANKAGLRKAAATKTARAAQRTPLPAKDHDKNVQLAQEAVAELKPKRGKASAPKAEEPPAGKAERYAGELAAAGWKPEVTRKDGLAEVVATRGAEAIYLSWLNEAHISGGSTYTYADRTVKVRNPAEAMRLAARPASAAKEAQAKVAANRSFVRTATGPQIRNVPFDVTTVTEEEIAEALAGHQISWHNQYRVETETAIVGVTVRVDRHKAGHRIVSFVDPESGFRAFKLENLENVGRKVNLERIKQEILMSLTREAKKTDRRAA